MAGGVVIETNLVLLLNSANAFLPFNGSPGHGAWERRDNCRIKFKMLKQMFGPTQQLLEFIRITVRARINGKAFSHQLANSNVELIFGPDPDAPPVVMFGRSTSEGKRVKVN